MRHFLAAKQTLFSFFAFLVVLSGLIVFRIVTREPDLGFEDIPVCAGVTINGTFYCKDHSHVQQNHSEHHESDKNYVQNNHKDQTVVTTKSDGSQDVYRSNEAQQRADQKAAAQNNNTSSSGGGGSSGGSGSGGSLTAEEQARETALVGQRVSVYGSYNVRSDGDINAPRMLVNADFALTNPYSESGGTILEVNQDTHYAKVDFGDGVQGWVALEALLPNTGTEASKAQKEILATTPTRTVTENSQTDDIIARDGTILYKNSLKVATSTDDGASAISYGNASGTVATEIAEATNTGTTLAVAAANIPSDIEVELQPGFNLRQGPCATCPVVGLVTNIDIEGVDNTIQTVTMSSDGRFACTSDNLCVSSQAIVDAPGTVDENIIFALNTVNGRIQPEDEEERDTGNEDGVEILGVYARDCPSQSCTQNTTMNLENGAIVTEYIANTGHVQISNATGNVVYASGEGFPNLLEFVDGLGEEVNSIYLESTVPIEFDILRGESDDGDNETIERRFMNGAAGIAQHATYVSAINNAPDEDHPLEEDEFIILNSEPPSEELRDVLYNRDVINQLDDLGLNPENISNYNVDGNGFNTIGVQNVQATDDFKNSIDDPATLERFEGEFTITSININNEFNVIAEVTPSDGSDPLTIDVQNLEFSKENTNDDNSSVNLNPINTNLDIFKEYNCIELDTNQNNKVDFQDFLEFARVFGQFDTPRLSKCVYPDQSQSISCGFVDQDKDGIVDTKDFFQLITLYGKDSC